MIAKKNKNLLARAAKKKIILIITGVGVPLLFFISLLCFLLLPIFTIKGDIYDHYSGAEDTGGIVMTFNGLGKFSSPIRDVASLTITSGYGMRYHPVDKVYRKHDGIDIACPQSTPITPIDNGVVIFAGESDGYGNLVITCDNDGYYVYYAHLSQISYKVGEQVLAYQSIIGFSGGTPGTPGAGTSTGPHLHLEIRKDGSTIDPADLMGLIQNNSNILAKDIKYVELGASDVLKVKNYLISKNSLLAEEPYFTTIMSTGKVYGINSLLLFAITGQEQSFVPITDSEATTIANNPFNVYGAWYEYNTDIADSAGIAAGTIINLSKDRPADADPIQWINTRGGKGGYAGDRTWYKGVSKFLKELMDLVNDD